jgi:hypothetical protein
MAEGHVRMKLRALVVGAGLFLAGSAVVHCGDDDGSHFVIQPDAGDGSTPSSSGFAVDAKAESGTNARCSPLNCGDLKINCGPAGDGCGGVSQCGECTQGQETCGGGGVPSVCGGSAKCLPKSCSDLKLDCGPAGDGCGGPLACGTCTAPGEVCGFGGPSKCGGGTFVDDAGLHFSDGGICQARGACQPGECGPIADGCGGLLECGGCNTAAGEICGLKEPSKCAAPTCTKLTCTQQGANCGFAADGCGGLLDCGGPNACAPAGEYCGGGGPNKCGVGTDAGAGCVNFCQDQLKNDACALGSRTRIKGTVYAPNAKLPVPDAVVFIPNQSKTFPYGLPTFQDGIGATGTCQQCVLQELGNPLVATKSLADGTFTLDNVPPDVEFPLVIQLGRWRRVIMIPPLTACSTTDLTPEQTRFAKKQNEGTQRDSIPLFAVSTGSVDGLECVLLKLGVDPSEFTNPAGVPGGGTGRVRLYQDLNTINTKPGARIDTNTPVTDVALTNSDANLAQYDAVLFACSGGENDRSDTIDDRVRRYADHGGRVYATHFNYVYLYDRTPWDTTAFWNTDFPKSFASIDARINTSFPKGATFAQWLGVPFDNATGRGVGALKSTNPPLVTIQEARGDAEWPIASSAQTWIMDNVDYPPSFATPIFHYTFNTPLSAPAAQQCGRVLYSDFHVTVGNTQDLTFPAECGGLNPPALTNQEKILAYFLFDLTSCITPTVDAPPPTCKKLSCADQGIGCGMAGDGCGGTITCTTCPGGQLCQGSPPKCVTPACAPSSCDAQGANCGQVSDGCGHALSCGTCDAGLQCGGSGPNRCGGDSCTAKTCKEQDIECGPAGDGCGGPLDCGPCPDGLTCGGGGVPNKCGKPNCTPRTCANAGASCGPIANGCGGLVDCGKCTNGQVCGGNGTPNVCGSADPF